MKTMLKKLPFAFIAALVLANASVVQPASASPHPRRHGPHYTYRPYDRSGAESLHQLSEENQQRAQQNSRE
jgi:hypothetical protein